MHNILKSLHFCLYFMEEEMLLERLKHFQKETTSQKLEAICKLINCKGWPERFV